MKKIIIPAVIAKTQKELDDIFSRIKDSARLLQLDIMDGKFVSNNSLDFDFRLPEKKYMYEAHLMIDDPEKWVDENWERVDTVIAHFESVKNPERIIESVKKKEKKIAFALNPETDTDLILNYIDSIDQVLVMTVNPGFYGSKFLPEMSDKIKRLRKLRPDLDIEVDGGIKPDTIEEVCEAGANMFVSGSYLVNSDNVKERIRILEQKIKTD
jgi:ribulose-phosphate 3-epimerase